MIEAVYIVWTVATLGLVVITARQVWLLWKESKTKRRVRK